MFLNPKCEVLWQTPKDFVYEGDTIWYNNSPVGKYLLGLMMTNIGKGGQLSRHYTNHSIRATSIVIIANHLLYFAIESLKAVQDQTVH
jgi:hypothetical protein